MDIFSSLFIVDVDDKDNVAVYLFLVTSWTK